MINGEKNFLRQNEFQSIKGIDRVFYPNALFHHHYCNTLHKRGNEKKEIDGGKQKWCITQQNL